MRTRKAPTPNGQSPHDRRGRFTPGTPDTPGDPAPDSGKAAVPASGPKGVEVSLRIGGDPATNPEAAHRLHLGAVAGAVYTNGVCERLARPFANLNLGESGLAFVLGLIEKMAPRDPFEEMLVVQALMAHLRAMHLSDLSWRQTGTENLKAVNEYADRASNTFRRLVLALTEYRRPPRMGDSFTAIRQANIAGQQVVMNAETRARNPANEQGCDDGETGTGSAGIGDRSTTALPPLAGGVGVPAGLGAAREALGAEHRAEDGGGEDPEPDERVEARGPGRGDPGGAGVAG